MVPTGFFLSSYFGTFVDVNMHKAWESIRKSVSTTESEILFPLSAFSFSFFYPVERGEIQFHFNSDSETSNFYGFTRFNFAKLLRRESEKKLEDLLEKLQSVGIFETNFYSPLPIP